MDEQQGGSSSVSGNKSQAQGTVLRPTGPTVQQAPPAVTNTQEPSQSQVGVNQPPPQPRSTPQQPQAQQPEQPPKVGLASKLSIKKILMILGALVAIIVLASVVMRFVGREKQPEGPVKLVWWGHTWDQKILEPFLEEYKEETGVEIEYVQQSTTDYYERLANSLVQGTGPDIFEYHNSWLPMFTGQLSSLPSDVMSKDEFSNTFFPVIVSDLILGDSIYGMPLSYDGLSLFVNESLFSSAQSDYPDDWDDVKRLAKEMTQTSGSQIIQSGLAMGSMENVDHWPETVALLMIQNGADLYNPVGESAEVALEYYMQFGPLGVWDETLPNSTEAFAAGKVAMYFAPSFRVGEIVDLNPNLKFRAIPLPQLQQDDPDTPRNSYATYWVNGVSNQSENENAAWSLLKHLSSRDVQRNLFDASSKSGVGFVYPRNDLAPILSEHKFFGPVLFDVPTSVSWYLADYTFDGVEGINTLMNSVFETAMLGSNYATLATDVWQVLSSFGVTSR